MASSSPPYHDLTYYSWDTPNGLKPAIVLEELKLRYKVKPIDINQNRQKEEWYLKINPNGRIPALTDGPLRIFESGAIMLYLVDQYDPENSISYAHGTSEHYEMLSWLMFQMGGLGPMQGQANHFRSMAKARSVYGIARYLAETKRLFSVVERQLGETRWLAGDKYTIADIACYSWIREAPIILELDLSEWPGISNWMKVIDARPAVNRAQSVPNPRPIAKMMEKYAALRKNIDSLKSEDKH